jgi:DNA uptake protein ComE-like DNA-binding protein
MFGLGLTEHSTVGEEMTMRECCEKLKLAGDTQARKIARCQVLLDKGLDMIRQVVREKLPSVAECWQSEININSASRRELGHQLGFTESEVDRLIAARQYNALQQLVDNAIIKPSKLAELQKRGAVAAFVPVDLNSATTRDIIDIVGAEKEVAQKLVSLRPFEHLSDLLEKKIIDKVLLERFKRRGAVLRVTGPTSARLDLNKATTEEIGKLGVPAASIDKLMRGRPFTTWAELEDFLCCDAPTWALLRQKFCLGLNTH